MLRQVRYDYDRMQYNTVVSGAMKLLNALEGARGLAGSGATAALREGYGILLRVLYPVCPHTTWLLWKELGYAALHGDLLDAPWPDVDESALVQDEIELMLQVNGRLRGSIRSLRRPAIRRSRSPRWRSPEFLRFADGRPIRKVIVVPGRLVNIVV